MHPWNSAFHMQILLPLLLKHRFRVNLLGQAAIDVQHQRLLP